jgi:hypothetical protein
MVCCLRRDDPVKRKPQERHDVIRMENGRPDEGPDVTRLLIANRGATVAAQLME